MSCNVNRWLMETWVSVSKMTVSFFNRQYYHECLNKELRCDMVSCCLDVHGSTRTPCVGITIIREAWEGLEGVKGERGTAGAEGGGEAEREGRHWGEDEQRRVRILHSSILTLITWTCCSLQEAPEPSRSRERDLSLLDTYLPSVFLSFPFSSSPSSILFRDAHPFPPFQNNFKKELKWKPGEVLCNTIIWFHSPCASPSLPLADGSRIIPLTVDKHMRGLRKRENGGRKIHGEREREKEREKGRKREKGRERSMDMDTLRMSPVSNPILISVSLPYFLWGNIYSPGIDSWSEEEQSTGVTWHLGVWE